MWTIEIRRRKITDEKTQVFSRSWGFSLHPKTETHTQSHLYLTCKDATFITSLLYAYNSWCPGFSSMFSRHFATGAGWVSSSRLPAFQRDLDLDKCSKVWRPKVWQTEIWNKATCARNTTLCFRKFFSALVFLSISLLWKICIDGAWPNRGWSQLWHRLGETSRAMEPQRWSAPLSNDHYWGITLGSLGYPLVLWNFSIQHIQRWVHMVHI